MPDHDNQVRLAAFKFLQEQTLIHGDVLPRHLLERGFDFHGERVPMISPQGIFTPHLLRIPLTFCTVPANMRKPRPYEDELNGEGGVIRYRYRGTDSNHRDNVGLRRACELQLPLVYLFGVVPGEYLPVWPVFIVGDDPAALTFNVMVDEKSAVAPGQTRVGEGASEAKRAYITVATRYRLHQASFRQRVLTAYRERCAVCRLKHLELLEAAHIVPDTHPRGEPIIPNGLALCKLHHAAFDGNIIGISPDCTVEVRADILKEHDGPMLRYGIQEIRGQTIWTPTIEVFRPDRELLDIRFEAFKKAG